MLFIHLSSECDVCQLHYTEDNTEKSPHTIPCGHVFCKECLETVASGHTGNRGPCPICRHPFQANSIKKLHVDVAVPKDVEIANGYLKRLIIACWGDDADLSRVVLEVDEWLEGRDSEEDEFEALRQMRRLVAQRQKLLLKKTEYTTTIHSLTTQLNNIQDSAIEGAELSRAKELSLESNVQVLERQLEQSKAEVALLRGKLSALGSASSAPEQNGRTDARRNKGKEKGKEKATFPSPPETPGPVNANGGTQPNPLPRPPAAIDWGTLSEQPRRYPNPSSHSNHPIPGPSRIPDTRLSHAVAGGYSSTQVVQPVSVPNPPYQPTPSPPRRNVILPGPPEQDINGLRRTLEALNIGKKPTEERRRKSKEKHRDKWAREAAKREEIRGVIGLGLINENIPEHDSNRSGPSGLNGHDAAYFEGYREAYRDAFEIAGTAHIPVTSAIQNRPTSQSMSRASHPSGTATTPAVSSQTQIQQMMRETIHVRSRPLAERQSIASDAADSTGTWHNDDEGRDVRRRSMDSDILQRLPDFPNGSPVVDRRASNASTISSNGYHHAFLPVHPVVNDTVPAAANVWRSGTVTEQGTSTSSRSMSAAIPAGSASTHIGFYAAETPRPQNIAAEPASGSVSRTQSTRESSRRRPHPTRHATLSTVAESTGSRSTRSNQSVPLLGTTPSAGHPTSQHATVMPDAGITEEPQAGLGNALGLDLSRDLGSESQQAFAQANATIVAPVPRASQHHQQFLRSYSGGL
ncbi:hypothetical protein VNI00_005281 [Paramarasmius palmivorus]|uniref:RING-type domain-containing protein n=1 Tax=Paramarasmius palmivorus TaxID=297713 RepID=A0AAW0DDK5_9AGAR